MTTVNDENSESGLSSFYSNRPVAEIDCLQKALSTLGEVRSFQPNEEVHAVRPDEKCLYLFTDGYFTVVRANDGLVLSSVRGEMIYGIAECLRPRGGWFLKVNEFCEARVVPAEQAFELFTRQQLWGEVSGLLAWYLQMYSLRDEHLVGVTAYVMIRNKLLELNLQPADVRRDINAADFIQQRTQLARSTIMAILGELRRGDYIEIKRGKLISIRYLPKEY